MSLCWLLPRWLSSKESACRYRSRRRCGFDPLVGKIPWKRRWHPTPVFMPRKIPWTEKPDRLHGVPRIRHSWATEHFTSYFHSSSVVFIAQGLSVFWQKKTPDLLWEYHPPSNLSPYDLLPLIAQAVGTYWPSDTSRIGNRPWSLL